MNNSIVNQASTLLRQVKQAGASNLTRAEAMNQMRASLPVHFTNEQVSAVVDATGMTFANNTVAKQVKQASSPFADVNNSPFSASEKYVDEKINEEIRNGTGYGGVGGGMIGGLLGTLVSGLTKGRGRKALHLGAGIVGGITGGALMGKNKAKDRIIDTLKRDKAVPAFNDNQV